MVYYALITISVLMFGGGFALQDVYRKIRGSSLKVSMESAFIGASAGLVVLLLVNGFAFEFTPFTIFMAICSALNGMLFTFCAFKALDHINLSLFSLFSMLGGMVLPFLQGILFFGEAVTIAKCVCVVLIVVALALTIEKGEKKKGIIFYVGIFVFNGASGVISKIFTESSFAKTSVAGYNIWIAVFTITFSLIVWLLLKAIEKRNGENVEFLAPRAKVLSYGISSIMGAINKIANFLLVIALVHVDASVQYPMVTGGTMIVSTLLCFFGNRKPSKKEIISIVFAFIGTLSLFLIPV